MISTEQMTKILISRGIPLDSIPKGTEEGIQEFWICITKFFEAYSIPLESAKNLLSSILLDAELWDTLQKQFDVFSEMMEKEKEIY